MSFNFQSCLHLRLYDYDGTYVGFFCRRTHYASLPYTVRINLLLLLLRQHVMIGHKELGRFVSKLKEEIGTSCINNWEKNLLDRLEEVVKPSPVNLEAITAVHLSDKVIERIKNDWRSKIDTEGVGTGNLFTCTEYFMQNKYKSYNEYSLAC